MKVKNIMFSGVMGVILMSVASSANAAIQVASKAYVDQQKNAVAGLVSAETEAREAADTALENAYKVADSTLDGKISAMDTAYKAADTALGARVTQNETDIAAVKELTGEEGVADQISAAKTELTQEINKKVDQTAYNTKVAELAGAITSGDASTLSDAKAYADGLATNYDAAGSAATAKSEAIAEAKSYADGLADNYDAAGSAAQALTDAKTYADGLNTAATEAIAKKVDQTAYDAKVAELAGAITSGDESTLSAAKTYADGLNTTASAAIEANADAIEAEATARETADTGLQTAIDDINDSDVMQSGINATKVSVLDGFIENNCSAASELCVLSKNKDGNYAWTDVTAPLDDQQN